MTEKKNIIEAALFSIGESLTITRLQQLFPETDRPELTEIKALLLELQNDYSTRGVQLQETASGFRFQVEKEYAPWLQRLFAKKPVKYSTAFLETLALIAYRQPITRGEIEDIRGISVNPNIMKTLQELEWIKIVGHKDVLGKPALFATTKQFLDYFNLKTLDDLPALNAILDLEQKGEELAVQLALPITEFAPAET